jgi:hypothetical protein
MDPVGLSGLWSLGPATPQARRAGQLTDGSDHCQDDDHPVPHRRDGHDRQVGQGPEGCRHSPHRDGLAIAQLIVHATQSLKDGFAQAQSAASQLPTTDPAAFAPAETALVSQINTAASTLNTTITQAATAYQASPLDLAFRTTSACKT